MPVPNDRAAPPPVEVVEGDLPLILAFPHDGTFMPEARRQRLAREATGFPDTDWHIFDLYDGLLPGATTVRATFSRYLIDANRDPSGKSLYPGMNTTGLCPVIDFEGQKIWREGEEPSPDDIAAATAGYHAVYHAALQGQVDRLRRIHGKVILFDCHSIRSRIPNLFDGLLPDFNIGTYDGRSCAPAVEAAVAEICANAQGFTHVLNGRFKGGWTTRHYGAPEAGVHAIQLELCQSTYLEAERPPWTFDPVKSARLREVLGSILETLEGLAREMGRTDVPRNGRSEA